MRCIILAAMLVVVFGTSGANAADRKLNANGCFEGRITCEEWCRKYREPANQTLCLRTHERSCMKKYGNLKVCVRDAPSA